MNVIPQQTDITIELRSPNDASRLAAREELLSQISSIMNDLNLAFVHEHTYEQAAVTCSPALSQALQDSIAETGIKPKTLFSGAGHDGLAVTDLTDIAMLFMRCKEGVSHHPDEAIDPQDLEVALQVLANFCRQLAQQNS
ncbi:N-carbamoyl-L-amino acid hydrolase [Vibrio astriarenae]|nr:N-carbamoyl-L-amino acid hydrolase [Vibrio sp. C7]